MRLPIGASLETTEIIFNPLKFAVQQFRRIVSLLMGTNPFAAGKTPLSSIAMQHPRPLFSNHARLCRGPADFSLSFCSAQTVRCHPALD